MAGVDLASEVVSDQLHAVADAEHGHARTERFSIDLRRAGVVHARRSAAQDEAGGPAFRQLRPGSAAGYELAVDVRLAHASRDQLAELRPEIKDENRLQGRGLLGPPGRGGLGQVTCPSRRAGPAGTPCPPKRSTAR